MSAETNLSKLLSSMTPTLIENEYVFVTSKGSVLPLLSSVPVLQFKENEGMTYIIAKDEAIKAKLPFEYPCRMITLNIHSSLTAVGFLATITTRLAAAGISVNAVSAFYHDHLFVPSERAEEALAILTNLAKENL